MLKKPLSFTIYLTILVILGLAVRHFAINPLYNNSAINTEPLFTTSLTNMDGIQQNLNQYKGKIIVLNFWATWCPPCREEMPELSQLQQEYKDRNIIVLGIAEDELTPVRKFLQSAPVTYPIFIADNSNIDIGITLGNDKAVLPYTVIIDTNGYVIDTFLGKINKSLLEKSLQTLLPH